MAHIASVAKTAPYAKVARPLISGSQEEARRRVLNLYRMWQREARSAIELHALDITLPTFRAKIREEFEKNRHVTDIRVIDMLVIKGKQELDEVAKGWKQQNHIMKYWDETPKQKDFLTRFYEGYD